MSISNAEFPCGFLRLQWDPRLRSPVGLPKRRLRPVLLPLKRLPEIRTLECLRGKAKTSLWRLQPSPSAKPGLLAFVAPSRSLSWNKNANNNNNLQSLYRACTLSTDLSPFGPSNLSLWTLVIFFVVCGCVSCSGGNKLAMCKFAALGRCNRGKACKFAHFREELQGSVNGRAAVDDGWCVLIGPSLSGQSKTLLENVFNQHFQSKENSSVQSA